VRIEIARLAGIQLEVGEEPGPMDTGDRAVRVALRDLYAQRFGAAELAKQKNAAQEEAAGEPTASDAKTVPVREKLTLWQRVGKLIEGEPQVVDASAFYRKLQVRLNQDQPLAADALTHLGAGRASAILAVLKETGVDQTRVTMGAPEKISSDAGKPVPLKLGLAAK
jgi:hypothetical protein